MVKHLFQARQKIYEIFLFHSLASYSIGILLLLIFISIEVWLYMKVLENQGEVPQCTVEDRKIPTRRALLPFWIKLYFNKSLKSYKHTYEWSWLNVSLESEFLHKQVNFLIHLEPVQIVGIALESHQESAEWNESW